MWKPRNTGDELSARIDELRVQLESLATELAALKRDVDSDMDELEREFRDRVDGVEKIIHSGSLDEKQRAKEAEDMNVIPGYKTWSQRKASRISKTHDPQFARRVVRRGTPTEANETP